MVTARDLLTMEELPLGAHLVLFYETREEHRNTLQPYLAEGLRRQEKVLYFYSEHQPEVITGYLADSGLDPVSLIESGQLELKPALDLFSGTRTPESVTLIALLQEEIDRALEAGFDGLRASGEVAWQAAEPDVMGLYDYHRELNNLLPGTKCILLCEYNKGKMHPDAVEQVLLAHPLLLEGHRIIRNPFYGKVEVLEEEKALTPEGSRWMECISDLQHHMGRERLADRDLIAAVLDVEGALVVVLDTQGRIELFNRACEELTGYTSAEVKGKPIFDLLIPPDERERVRAVFKSLRAGDLPNRYENRWVTRDGTTRLIAWSNTGLLDDAGNVEHVIGTGLDITELRQLEEAQRESARRSEVVAQLATDFIYEYEPGADELRWFGDIDSYLGFAPGEAPRDYRGWMDLIHPEDRERVMSKLAKTRETGEPFADEHRVLKKDGTVLYWMGRAAALKDEGGVPVKFVGAVRDITGRKEVDENLIQSESRFRSLFENAPFGIVIHRLGSALLANRAILELFKLPLDTEPRGLFILDYIIPEERERIADNYLRRAAGEDIPSTYETTGLRTDGTTPPLWLVVVPVELDDGPALMVFMVDITERKNYENTLRQKAEELKNFLTIAAHELRHPITILKGYARVIGEYQDNPMVQQNMPEILQNVDQAANRLDRLVDELLDVSRIEQGRMEISKEPVAVSDLLARAIDEMHLQAVANPISFRVGPGANEVIADPEKLDRLLLILLENAANFAAPNTPVEIEAEMLNGAEMMFSVLDRGSGIPEEARERVFDRFYQVAEVEYHSVPGLGMGLYIARQIVEAHGGRIWNEPREGGGTAFRFTLPTA